MILVMVVFVVMIFLFAMIRNLKDGSASSTTEGWLLSLKFHSHVGARVREISLSTLGWS